MSPRALANLKNRWIPRRPVLPDIEVRWFAVALALGVLVTAAGWSHLRGREQDLERAHQEAAADRLQHQLSERLGKVDFILRGVSGLFNAQSLVERREFESYVAGLKMERALPEVVGIALLRRVETSRVAAVEALLSAAYDQPIRILPRLDPTLPGVAFPIVYIWPVTQQGLKAVGYDGYVIPRRRRAIDAALSTGDMAMTEPLPLRMLESERNVTGVLLYRVARALDDVNPAEMQDSLIGLGIDVARLFDDVRGAAAPDYGLVVEDVSGAAPQVFYASGESMAAVPSAVRELTFGGQTWRLSMRSPASGTPVAASTLAGAGGLAGSLLIASLLASLSGQQRRAREIAALMTEEYRYSEERFELAVAATEDGIWEWRAERPWLYLSPRCDRLMGYPEGGLPRSVRGVLRLMAEPVRHDLLQTLRDHLRGTGTLECVVPVSRRDGRVGWFQLACKTEFDTDGRPRRIAGAVSDVTALHCAQQEVLDAHARLDALYRHASLGMALVDDAGRYLQANAEFCRIVGYSEEELRHDGLRLTPPEYAGQDRRAVAEAVVGGRARAYEKEFLRKDGQRVPVVVTVSAVGGCGRAHRWVVAEDVTVRKHAELALRTSEARWQFALDGAGDGVWDWNIPAGTVFRSRRWHTLLGYEPGELSDRLDEWSSRIHPEDLPAVEAIEMAHLRGESPSFSHETRMRCKDGRYKWILARGLVVERDAEGRPLRMIGTCTDIDEVKAREAQILNHNLDLAELVGERTKDLLAAKEAAEAAYKAKSAFLANMSHELRTPMHSIISYARLGEARVATAGHEKLHGYFNRIRVSCDRLILLVNDLLDLSKLEAGRMILNRVPVQLEGVLRDVIEEFELLLRSRRQRLEFNAGSGLPACMVDAVRIEQVVRNLLSNAVKFTPEGRAIHVSLGAGRRADGAPVVVFSVSDEGVGIPPDELHTVFDKFVQSSRTRTGAGGTGLGLAICREIVDAHHGRIVARNNAAGGAEFIVELPMGGEPERSQPAALAKGETG